MSIYIYIAMHRCVSVHSYADVVSRALKVYVYVCRTADVSMYKAHKPIPRLVSSIL